MEEAILTIPNISCEHCVRSITDELAQLDGVVSVVGNPEAKTATVAWEHPATLAIIKAALEEIEYPSA